MTRLILTFALLLGVSAEAELWAQSTPLVPGEPVKVGPGSGGMVLADVDRDGHLDLITQHLLQKNVAVQLGDGKGHFAPADKSPLQLDYQPSALAAADVSGDGLIDLVIGSRDNEREYLHIYLGDRQGVFNEAAGSPLTVGVIMKGYKPTIRLADVNEDGKLDIVHGNARRNDLEILLGDGRGKFAAPTVLKLSGRGLQTFVLGDANADGHLDIVIASTGGEDGKAGSVVIWRGDGKGQFQEGTPSPAAPAACIKALADLDGDGNLDAAFSHGERNQLSVMLGDGEGGFKSAPGSPIDVKLNSYAVVVADLNRDKSADLVAATVSHDAPFESQVAILLGDGGRFAPAPGSPLRVGVGAYNLAAGDVNEDGRLDVVASSFEGDAVTLLLGR